MPVLSDAASSHLEPFVNAREASKFVRLHPVTVQRLAREGLLPGHPVSNGLRRHWRFRLSELGRWLQARESERQQSVISSKSDQSGLATTHECGI